MRNEEQSVSSYVALNSELRTSSYGVPWSIALLTLVYGVIATTAAVSVWHIASGVVHQSLVWPVVWLAFSGGAMCGLPLGKAWGRTLALCTSWLLLIVMLAIAGRLIVTHHPLAALLTAFLSGTHVVLLRYLQRPSIKRYFGCRNADFGFTPQSEFRNLQ